jgi:hypothetical protein
MVERMERNAGLGLGSGGWKQGVDGAVQYRRNHRDVAPKRSLRKLGARSVTRYGRPSAEGAGLGPPGLVRPSEASLHDHEVRELHLDPGLLDHRHAAAARSGTWSISNRMPTEVSSEVPLKKAIPNRWSVHHW